jgi:ribulose bisphosphate carboxylase small subunit
MAPKTTNEKNFKCHLCDKAYTQQANLCTHYKTIHPGQNTLKKLEKCLRDDLLDQLNQVKELLEMGYVISIEKDDEIIHINKTI